MFRQISFGAAFVATLATAQSASAAAESVMPAGVAPGGTITAIWSNVVTSGYVLNDPAPGSLTLTDNTGTAVYSGVGTNTLTWGSNTGTSTQGTDYSSLSFVGNTIPVNYGSPFTVGTLTFTNGTSSLASLIFDATLSFYEGTVFLGSDDVSINTTSNQYSGTSLTSAQLATDADYVNICGPFSTICGVSIEAYENTETTSGSSYAADLTGYIDDLILTGVTPANGAGTVGSEPPLSTVPEPSGAAAAVAGLAVLLTASFRQRRRG